METLRTLKHLSVAALAVTGALAVSGCRNTEGKGNDFAVVGRVTSVGDQSVHVKVQKILLAKGKARGWFDDFDVHMVHDNYNECDFSNPHEVGDEFDVNGQREELESVHPGELVRLDGKIRESAELCGKYPDFDFRPVFDRLTELSGIEKVTS